jgi:tetratricopeptide (TPR) repeat protein
MLNLVRSILPTRPEESEKLSRDVHVMREKLLGSEHPDVAWSLYNLAFVLLTRDKLAEAEEMARTVLSRRGPNLPDEHPVVSSTFIVLGRTLLAKGSVAEALDSFETCLDLRERTLPGDHWLLATTRSFIGECLVRLGNADAGRRMLRDSYESLGERLGGDHDQTKEAYERWMASGV